MDASDPSSPTPRPRRGRQRASLRRPSVASLLRRLFFPSPPLPDSYSALVTLVMLDRLFEMAAWAWVKARAGVTGVDARRRRRLAPAAALDAADAADGPPFLGGPPRDGNAAPPFPAFDPDLPSVLVQLPMFNETAV